MEFTALDGIVAVIVLISGILAYARGFVRETLAIGAWIAAGVAAYYFAPGLTPLMAEIPVLGDFLQDSCGLRTIVATAVVFVGALLILSIFTPLFAGAVQRSAVGGIDQALGFLFGVARGLLLVAIGLLVYNKQLVSDPLPIVDNSQTMQMFAQVLPRIDDQIPDGTPPWADRLMDNFMAHCGGSAGLSSPETSTTTDQ